VMIRRGRSNQAGGERKGGDCPRPAFVRLMGATWRPNGARVRMGGDFRGSRSVTVEDAA